jgi:hypothetical protein
MSLWIQWGFPATGETGKSGVFDLSPVFRRESARVLFSALRGLLGHSVVSMFPSIAGARFCLIRLLASAP